MELFAVYVLLAAVLTLPFALWVFLRRARWRDPGKAVAYGYATAVLVTLAVAGLLGWLYPFGFPGRSEREWRAAALECQARYATARTPADSSLVHMVQPGTGDAAILLCQSLLNAGLLDSERQCRPGSRCARIRGALRLPDP